MSKATVKHITEEGERRFYDSVPPGFPYDDNPEPCYEWAGRTNGKGYGYFRWPGLRGGTYAYAHRVAYQLAGGSLRDGRIVRHDCDNPACINPHHLRDGTLRDNFDDMVERGRCPSGWNALDATRRAVRERRTDSYPST